MMMNNQTTRFWTFNTLTSAFLDLFIAYFLLCGSTVALFAVKFLGFFGFSLPDCYLTDKFRFDSVFGGGYDCSLEDQDDLNVEVLEGEASCSSKLEVNGVEDCVSCCSSNWVTCVDQQSNNGEEYDGGFEATSIPSDVNKFNFSRYQQDAAHVDPNDEQKRIPDNEADKDKMIVLLTRELEESQAARAALYVELEKERNAAASAADEAMSMILRLQEEKASVKMESRQYQRMIEEKSAFDAEEMNILKEIVLRREREKHFLEKQVEAYRQMTRDQNDQIYEVNDQDLVQDPDLILHQLSSSRLYEDVDFCKQDEAEKTIAVVGQEKSLEIMAGDASHDSEIGSFIYDVHVIDNELNSSEKFDGNDKQTEQKQIGSETRVGLPQVSSKSSLRRYSTSALDNERTRIATEVEWLRERLRIVQEGKVKLNFSVNNREKESLQMQLLEDIARQLKEIRMLTEPRTTRQVSLPSSSEVLKKKKRCRSVSSVHATSS